VQLTGPIGNEFIVQLAPASAQQSWISPEEFGRQRRQLLFDTIAEISLKSPRQRPATANGIAAAPQAPSP
jgi:hypothetical protein